MPNGRSGSLFLDKGVLERWLGGFGGTEIIGFSVTPSATNRLSEVSVEMVMGLLARYPEDRIAVEEQDGAVYVIHLYYPLSMDPADPEKWIMVRSESPLFQELRRQHQQQGKWGAGYL